MSAWHPDRASFDFMSRWQLSAGREIIYDALVDFPNWPDWWSGLRSVEETAPGGKDGIGQRAVSSWRGPIGYRINVGIEALEKTRPEYLRGAATGEVEGSGEWRFSEVPPESEGGPVWTQVAFNWNVVVTRKWMELLAPLARPLFVYSHGYVIRKGAEGLAEYLGCEMREFVAADEKFAEAERV